MAAPDAAACVIAGGYRLQTAGYAAATPRERRRFCVIRHIPAPLADLAGGLRVSAATAFFFGNICRKGVAFQCICQCRALQNRHW
ncbi:hypothetical protein ACFFJ7_11315 [Pseudochelatococcus lubricantis]|uniref:hypothetical protein n=1 Tax=Pseudochelatococcus lubricantis TaxID=1538102 RepID=UPI0035EA5FB5